MAFDHWVDPTQDPALAMGEMWGTQGCYGAPIGAMGHPWVLWGHLKVNQGSLWGSINTQTRGKDRSDGL